MYKDIYNKNKIRSMSNNISHIKNYKTHFWQRKVNILFAKLKWSLLIKMRMWIWVGVIKIEKQ